MKLLETAWAKVIATMLVCGSMTLQGNLAHSQTMRVAVTDLPPSKGNPYRAGIFPSWFTWTALYDAMTFVDPAGDIQPQAASSWRNLDQTTWQFIIRDDMRFDNGEALDAAAVVTAVSWLKTEAGRATNVGRQLAEVVSARAVDSRTVEIKTAIPDAILPGRISAVFIVAPKAWADIGPDGYADRPVGSGAFKVSSWTPEKVVFSGRPDSWRKPFVSGLEIRALGEPAARVQALVSDQVDIALRLSTDNVKTVESAGRKVDISPSTSTAGMSFVNTSPNSPFKDVRVRQAFNYAVDKNAIAKNLFDGRVKVASQGATPNTFGYNPALSPYPYDPNNARSLLAQAGFIDSLKVVSEVVVGSAAGDSEMYQQVAQDLAKVGVTLELRQIPSADWIKKFNSGGWEGTMFGGGQNSAPLNDASRFLTFISCKKPNPYYCDENVVPRLEESGTNFDAPKRRKLLNDLLQVQHDSAAALFLLEQVEIVGLNKRVSGLVNLGYSLNYDRISLN